MTQAEIQQLLDQGGHVRIPAGNHSITSPLTIDASRVCVDADGATINYYGGGPALVIGNGSANRDDVRVSGLTLFGGGVETRYVFRAHLERLQIQCAQVGLRLTRAFQTRAVGLDVRNCSVAGVVIDGAPPLNNSNDQYLTDVRVVCEAGFPKTTGVLLQRTSGLWMTNVGTIGCHDGFVAAPTAAGPVEYVFTTNCTADSGSGFGWRLDGTGGLIQGWTMTGDWAATNAQTGFRATACSDLNLHAPRVLNNLKHGMHFVSCSNCSLEGGSVSGNGSGGVPIGSHHGVVIDGCNGFRVIGLRSGQFGQYANTQGHGLLVGGGSLNVIAAHNDLRNNLLS